MAIDQVVVVRGQELERLRDGGHAGCGCADERAERLERALVEGAVCLRESLDEHLQLLLEAQIVFGLR
jgi:hypothetical protein